MTRRLAVWTGAAGLAACSPEAPTAAKAAPAAETPAAPATAAVPDWLPGGAWRAVWVERDGAGKQSLVTLENGAAGGPKILLSTGGEVGSLHRPLWDSAGAAVIFTDLPPPGDAASKPEVFRVGADGAGLTKLGAGAAVEVWRDPAAGTDFVYALETVTPSRNAAPSGETMVRFSPAKPEEREIVWTESAVGLDQFQLSADGSRGAGVFPWPRAALANMADHTLTPLAHGAWPSLAPDDSYAAWVLDGSRRRLRVFAPNLEPGWELNFDDEPLLEKRALYHPRWSNDALSIVFTSLDPAAEESRAGDVLVARLRDDLRRVESVTALTQGRRALMPDLWVRGGAEVKSALPQKPVVTPKQEPKPWPVSADGLVWAWENAKRPDASGTGFAAPALHGCAVADRFFGMNVSTGTVEADQAITERLARECAVSGAWAMELLLTERRTEPPVSVRLAVFEMADGRTPFALYRVDRKLVLRLLLGGIADRPALEYPVVLTHLAIEDDRPVHVLFSLKGDRLGCYVDGRMMKEFQLESAGLAAWSAGRLYFGDPQPYGSPWTGAMERVALYSRALSADEISDAAAAAAQWTEGRKRPARVKLRAKLLEAPSVESTEPRAMSLSVWEAGQVDIGQMPAKRFALQSWTRLDGKPVANGFPPVGGEIEMWLEPLEAHPETDGQAVENRTSANDLPVYFDAAPPGRRAQTQPPTP